VEKAIHGLFPLCRPVEKPRFSMVGDRRIVRRLKVRALELVREPWPLGFL
jgi:hypothetical protein